MNNTNLQGKVSFRSECKLAIHVTDLEQAENFYSNILGFNLLEKRDGHLVYDTGEITLYINQDDKSMSFIPGLEVTNYEQAKSYLIASGCEIIKEWPNSKALYFLDPAGNVIDIKEIDKAE